MGRAVVSLKGSSGDGMNFEGSDDVVGRAASGLPVGIARGTSAAGVGGGGAGVFGMSDGAGAG